LAAFGLLKDTTETGPVSGTGRGMHIVDVSEEK